MKLKVAQLEFMLAKLDLPAALRTRLELSLTGDRTLSDDDADALRDLCGDRLQTNGFDEGYRPTPDGRMLENLIDVLFTG